MSHQIILCSKFCTGKMAAHIVKCKSPSTMTIMQIVSEIKMSIDYVLALA